MQRSYSVPRTTKFLDSQEQTDHQNEKKALKLLLCCPSEERTKSDCNMIGLLLSVSLIFEFMRLEIQIFQKNAIKPFFS